MADRGFAEYVRCFTLAIVSVALAGERRRPNEALHGKTGAVSHGEAISTPSILPFVLLGGVSMLCHVIRFSSLAGIGSVASPDEAYAMPDEPGFAKERTALPKQEPSTRQSQTNNIVDADRVGHQSPGYAIDKSEAYMLTDRPVDAIGLHFEPTVLGITKRAFLSDSWASSASFQEAKKVLMESALESKIDFLYGLKSNLIVGRYIRAGTSFQ